MNTIGEHQQEYNQQDDGLQLLKKVIESNEKNTLKSSEILYKYENFISLISRTEDILQGVKTEIHKGGSFLDETSKILQNLPKKIDLVASEEEQKSREDFINSIPKRLEIHHSDEVRKNLEIFNENAKNISLKSEIFRYSLFANLGSLVLSIIVLGLSFYFSKQWYSESIKTKEEIRAELLKEIEKEGKGVYEKTSYEKLKYNTDLINKWIENNPRDAEKFLRFKNGYEAR